MDLIVRLIDGQWRAAWGDSRFPCAVGRGGLVGAAAKREGDGATPVGRWALRHLLFRPDRERPQTAGLPAVALAPDDGWCDDPGHRAYNRAVKLPFPASHEQMWRDDGLYDLVVVLAHNDAPPVPGRGSAIFLHCARADFGATEGCVALAHDDLRRVLREAGPGDAVRVEDSARRPDQG